MTKMWYLRNENRHFFFHPRFVRWETHRQWCEDGSWNENFYIIYDGTTFIGTISENKKNGYTELGHIIIDAPFRRLGYFTKVIGLFHGVLQVHVRGDNQLALMAYKKLGFQLTEREVGYNKLGKIVLRREV
jgi:ribosomal protein S18 acetylase RimI-like enzyme